MSKEISSQYNPRETEEKIYRLWMESGFFAPEAHQLRTDNPKSYETFCVSIPPPNITGSLHMGHALNATIQDILIRKKRMEGYKTLWVPGTDHAGIATQNVVEKNLKKQGISRHDCGREKFLEKILEWKEKYGAIILDQFKKIGVSMDWSRTRFTMDEKYQEAVVFAFLHYHKNGLLYRAEKVINWCTRCQTSLSDLEIEYREEKTKLYYIKYPCVQNKEGEKKKQEWVIVATTRPETMLGDSAIAVHPSDARYKNLIGTPVILPIQNREIPIIADKEIDENFGTGAVKVTPAHDLLDARIGEKNNLPIHKVIGPLGKMTEGAGSAYAGLKVAECRQVILEELARQNLVEKIEEYTHNVAVCYRCEGGIEPLPSLQWFLKMEKLAEKAIEAVEKGEIRFYPKSWEKVYFDWLKNVHDWNISRQIWWGHRIPVFYCDKKLGIQNAQNEERGISDFVVADKKPTACPFCGKCEMVQETDVLDTWFSSALWPFAILGWPKKTKDLEAYYPNHVLSTARDIINLWVARMIYSGLEFTGQKPFTDVIIHATVLTKDGKRMSKSLGTGIDPMDLIEKYGADATRFGIIWQNMGTQDIRWAEEHVFAGKKFANKLWNMARFVMIKTENVAEIPVDITAIAFDDTARAFYQKLTALIPEVSKKIDDYEFGHALHVLYGFIWYEFADTYIEYAKEHDTKENLILLRYALIECITVLHPFMPFITEEIYSTLHTDGALLMIKRWPSK